MEKKRQFLNLTGLEILERRGRVLRGQGRECRCILAVYRLGGIEKEKAVFEFDRIENLKMAGKDSAETEQGMPL